MPKLPEITDFDEADHPGLIPIFRQIDLGIAAIIAGDPALRPKGPARRRVRSVARSSGSARPRRTAKRAAA